MFLLETGGFPRDFSILTTLRLDQNTAGFLFGVHDPDGQEQLSLHVGENVTFAIRSDYVNESQLSIVTFPEPVNDGKWVTTSRRNHFHLLFFASTKQRVLQQLCQGAYNQNKFNFLCIFPRFRWHRLSLSVKGNSVTLVKDCAIQETEEVVRTDEMLVDSSGLTLLGQKFDSDEMYQVRSRDLLPVLIHPMTT